MPDLDFDELHKGVEQMKQETSPYGDGDRRSTSRKLKSFKREARDTARTDGESIKVNFTKAPLKKPEQIVSSGSAVDGIVGVTPVAATKKKPARRPRAGKVEPVIESVPEYKTPEVAEVDEIKEQRIQEAEELVDSTIGQTVDVNEPYDPDDQLHEMVEKAPKIEEFSSDDELSVHEFAHDEYIADQPLDLPQAPQPPQDLIGEPPMQDQLHQEEVALTEKERKKQDRQLKKDAKRLAKQNKKNKAPSAPKAEMTMTDTGKPKVIWDILYYLIVFLLVITIISLIMILLDKFEVINLPSWVPFIS